MFQNTSSSKMTFPPRRRLNVNIKDKIDQATAALPDVPGGNIELDPRVRMWNKHKEKIIVGGIGVVVAIVRRGGPHSKGVTRRLTILYLFHPTLLTKCPCIWDRPCRVCETLYYTLPTGSPFPAASSAAISVILFSLLLLYFRFTVVPPIIDPIS